MSHDPAEQHGLPWHVYEGGNFVRIASNGYDELVEKSHYLAGSICEMDDQDNDANKVSHKVQMQRAELIVAAVNSYAQLTRQRDELAEALRTAKAWMDKNSNDEDGVTYFYGRYSPEATDVSKQINSALEKAGKGEKS